MKRAKGRRGKQRLVLLPALQARSIGGGLAAERGQEEEQQRKPDMEAHGESSIYRAGICRLTASGIVAGVCGGP
jgi:hypothetical protein